MNEHVDLTTTLIEVAHYYYVENLSQQEIADKLKVSRSLIALYLKKAKEDGIVHIEIVDPHNLHQKLGYQVREKYNLAYVNVVPSAHNSNTLTTRALGNAVAAYLDQVLKDGDTLGLGWGRTITEIANLLAPARPRQINVVPLLGESGNTGIYSRLNQIVLEVAKSFCGTPYFLLAPILVGSPRLREAFVQDESTQDVIDRWNRLDVVCFGIGSNPPTEGQIVYIGEENLARMRQKGIIGDICARYFDRDGKFIDNELSQRVIGVGLEQLYKAKTVIAVGSGIEKSIAVRGALKLGLINTLFIDEVMANALLVDSN